MTDASTETRVVRAARGNVRTAKSWGAEAAKRMLMNNLDPEVAEHPEDLVVYGGTGKAARSWEAYDAIVRSLRDLEDDETLLVQSGKPVGIMRTHTWAPRVLIANSNLVGDWADWEEFRRLEDLGLTMYGQMTAGSWIYIGTQGILQGTFETFAAIADLRFGGTLAGTITVTAGLGGMGGAQPLAVTMNDGVAICVECDQHRIDRRLETRYLDVQARDLDHAIELALEARDQRRGLSIGVLGNAADAPQSERTKRAAMPVALTHDAADLGDAHRGHQPSLRSSSSSLETTSLTLSASASAASVIVWAAVLVFVIVYRRHADYESHKELFWWEAFYRTGSLIFGGGQVILQILPS